MEWEEGGGHWYLGCSPALKSGSTNASESVIKVKAAAAAEPTPRHAPRRCTPLVVVVVARNWVK